MSAGGNSIAEAQLPELDPAKRSKPVLVFAGIGALFLALTIYIWVAWFTSGDLTPTPDGPSELPGWLEVSVWAQQIIPTAVALWFIFHFIVKPWRKERRIGLDGTLVIVSLLLYWQDPLVNYNANWVTYNTHFIQFGSWAAEIPGWNAPNGNLFPEPPLFAASAYLWFLLGGMIVANAFMRAVKRRRPQTTTLQLVGWCFAFCLFFDIVIETFWLRTATYSYPGAVEGLTLFHGNYYQFPIYEGLAWAAAWTAMACLRYFRDDKGNTLVERGIDRVKASARTRGFLRFLALLGAMNMILLSFNMWNGALWAPRSDPWPADYDDRTYLRDGLCGPGTDYACTGPEVPNPRPDSAHVRPDGTLAPPTGDR